MPCRTLSLERLDPLVPEPQHARPQRLGGPLVVEPHVGGRAPGLVVGLCGDAGPRVGLRHPPLPGEPPEPDLLGRPDDDDEVVLRRHRLLDERGMSCTTTASTAACATSSAVRAQIAGWVMRSRSRRAVGFPNTRRPSAGRSSRLSRSRTSVPKRSAIAARAGIPGSTTSRATASASTTTAPSEASWAATVDLPEPIPPVRPTRSMSATLALPVRPTGAGHRERARGRGGDGHGEARPPSWGDRASCGERTGIRERVPARLSCR